jgi:putative transposase
MADKLVENKNNQIQYRALKLRIYPNSEQEILINKTFGCVRKRYNIYLAENKEFYENTIKPEENPENRKELWKTPHLSTEKELREQFPYMKEVSAQALCSAQMDAKKAFSNFFNSL